MTWDQVEQLIVNFVGTIALINLIAIIVQLSKEFSKLRGDNSKIIRAISLGILGGLFGIYGTLTGYPLNGTYISIRDIGPMMSGLLGGPISGLIGGLIAGLFRLLYGIKDGILNGTTIPCSIATVIIGVLTGVIYTYLKPKKHRLIFAFCLGLTLEVLHLFFIFLYMIPVEGAEAAFNRVISITLPYLLTNSIGFAILVYVLNFIRRIRKEENDKKSIENELNTATNIQSSMLPIILPDFPGRSEIDIYAEMHPAKEVGGDFYDFFFIDQDHFCFLVADVSGKGVPAALFMVISKTILKNNIQSGISLSEAIKKTNNQLLEGNSGHMFVTSWIGVLEFSTGTIKFVNAGHNPPLVRQNGKDYFYLKNRSGIILGGKKDIPYKEYNLSFLPGDDICLYTDGVNEAMNSKNEEFGEANFAEAMNKISEKVSSKEIVQNIQGKISDFVNGNEQSDDITILNIKMNGETSYLESELTDENFDKFDNFMEGKLLSDSVNRSIIMKFKVAFDEIYSNLIKYSKGTKLKLGVSTFNNEAIVAFRYDGDDFDVTKVNDPDINLKSEDRKIGGLGLFIVKKTMDKVTFNRNKNENTLVIRKSLGGETNNEVKEQK